MSRLPLIALCVVLASAGVAPAQTPTLAGTEFLVNTYTTGRQNFFFPTTPVAMDPQGNFVVIWSSQNQEYLGGYGVFGQRYDALGADAPAGDEFHVNTYTPGEQRFGAVAKDAAGNFIVAWAGAGAGDNRGIFGQRYDADGVAQGENFRVNTHTTANQYGVAVAAQPRGSFVVIWGSYDQEGPGSHYGIFGQRYDAAGSPVGGEFHVNTYTTGAQYQPAVAHTTRAGDFVVVWRSPRSPDEDGNGIFGQRFNAAGAAVGSEFKVNTYTTDNQYMPSVSSDGASGSFVVVWSSQMGGFSGADIYGQRFDAAGQPAGGEFRVNEDVFFAQVNSQVASDATGGFIVAWATFLGDPDLGIKARRFDADGTPRGTSFQVNTNLVGGQNEPGVASDPSGNFVIAWYGYEQDGSESAIKAQRFGGLRPTDIVVDDGGNDVLETGENMTVQPSWHNFNGGALNFASQATLTGPTASGVVYNLPDAGADYGGDVASGTAIQCTDCYTALSITAGATRPARHWDATLAETTVAQPPTIGELGQRKNWLLHVGDSFDDVPRSSGFYALIETLLHNGVTSGCALSGDRLSYCPTQSTTREQMSKFVLIGKEGADYVPPACDPADARTFADVPASNGFCPFIEELFRRGVVNGCALDPLRYCPQNTVTREQMAKFVLLTLDPAFLPPPCSAGNEVFADVPFTNGFCPYIEELFDRGVVNGCALDPLRYCPTNPVTREQMSKFLTLTFELELYGL